MSLVLGEAAASLAAASANPAWSNDDIEAARRNATRTWRSAQMIWMVMPFATITFAVMGPRVAMQGMAQDLYGNDAEVYMNFSDGIRGALALVGAPVLGGLSDRFGRKPLLFLSFAMTLLPALLLLVLGQPLLVLGPLWPQGGARRYSIYLVVNSLMGVVNGGTAHFVLSQAYVADTCAKPQRAATFAKFMVLASGPPLLFGAPVFSLIDKHWGFSGMLHVQVAMMSMACFWVLIMPESRLRSQQEEVLTLRALNPRRYFCLLLGPLRCQDDPDVTPAAVSIIRTLFCVVVALYLAKMGLLMSLSLYAQEAYNFSEQRASLLLTDYGTFLILGQLCIPLFLRVLSKRMAIAMGVSSGVIAGVLLSLPGLPGDILFVAEAVLSFSFVAYTVSVATASEVVPQALTGEAVGIINAGLAISEGFGPPTFGLLVRYFLDTDYKNGAFPILTAIMSIGLLLVTRLPTDAVIASERKLASNENLQEGPQEEEFQEQQRRHRTNSMSSSRQEKRSRSVSFSAVAEQQRRIRSFSAIDAPVPSRQEHRCRSVSFSAGEEQQPRRSNSGEASAARAAATAASSRSPRSPRRSPRADAPSAAAVTAASTRSPRLPQQEQQRRTRSSSSAAGPATPRQVPVEELALQLQQELLLEQQGNRKSPRDRACSISTESTSGNGSPTQLTESMTSENSAAGPLQQEQRDLN